MTKNSTKWNQQIDSQLRTLFQDQSIKEWVLVAQKLNSTFGEPIRSAKQCRERYLNSVKFRGSSKNWSPQQQEILKNLIIEEGLKWSLFTNKLPGRAQNSIKNKFNAELRKTLRKLNSVCKNSLLKHRKQLDNEWFRRLHRVVYENEPCSSQRREYAERLMKQMIELIFRNSASERIKIDEEVYKGVLENICSYNKNFIFSKKGQNISFKVQIDEETQEKQAKKIMEEQVEQAFSEIERIQLNLEQIEVSAQEQAPFRKKLGSFQFMRMPQQLHMALGHNFFNQVSDNQELLEFQNLSAEVRQPRFDYFEQSY